MSTEQLFLKWLKRKDKSFKESLQFALNSWKSCEFGLGSKYDIILNWVAEEANHLETDELPIKEYEEILKLRAQPALISLESKRKFVETTLKHAEKTTAAGRIFPELLYKLLALEWMQDLLRGNSILTARIYGRMLQCYEAYLNECNASNNSQLTSHEADFFAKILNFLKEQLKNAVEINAFADAYDSHVLQPLTQVLLLLRNVYGINFFDEIRELERNLRENRKFLVKYLLELPLPSSMLTLECAIANRPMDQKLLLTVFEQVFAKSTKEDLYITPSDVLLRAAYILDVLRKYNVLLNFDIGQKKAVKFLGDLVYDYVRENKNEYLREILILLCAVLRLNPLILQQHIFEITTWMIVAPKRVKEDGGQTLELFEKYLSLLLDMFRRLSRAEKFVVDLLKALKVWLSQNQLEPLALSPKKLLKRKSLQNHSITSNKHVKLENDSSAYIITNDSNVAMLFHEIFQQLKSSKQQFSSNVQQSSFLYLQCAWPSSTIGYAFSSLITSLVSKASLTIWKTLLFALKEQLEFLNEEPTITENSYFRLDFHSALLCQYFGGARPIEQYEKYTTEIGQLRKQTKEVISTFGKFILARTFHKRFVNAFLECTYAAANFELMLAYYKPDGAEDESLDAINIIGNLHSYLELKQWDTLEERIIENGKSECRTLFERLKLQRAEASKLLLQKSTEQKDPHSKFDYYQNTEELIELLNASDHGSWILAQLNRGEKAKLIKYKMKQISSLEDHNFLNCCSENVEALELLIYSIFEYLCKDFTKTCKNSLLATLNFDFKSIRQTCSIDHQELDKIIKTTVNVIVQNSLGYKIEELPHESVCRVLKLLKQLPLGQLRRQAKSLLFTFYLAFYQDLKIAQADEEAKQLFDCLTYLLHFGQQVPIFRYFEMKNILQLLPIADCWDFYKFLFSTIKNEEKGTDEFLKSLEDLLSNTLTKSNNLRINECRLMLLAIDTLSGLSGQIGRRIHKHLNALLKIYGDLYVYPHFEKENSQKIDAKFVNESLAGFAPFAKAVLGASSAANTTKDDKKNMDRKEKEYNQIILKPLDETFRRICKIYIGNSLDYRNPHSLQLIQLALKNSKLLHLDLDEIEFVLNSFWRQLNEDIKKSTQEQKDETSIIEDNSSVSWIKNAENLVKIIIENKTNEDFLLTLKDIGSNMIDERSYMNVINLLSLIAKSSFSNIKGAIFNDQFKQISGSILLRISKNRQQNLTNEEILLKMASCQQACIENRTIHLTPDTLDTILGFMIDINIKKYPISDKNTSNFYALHNSLTSLCSSIIKHRHILLMDRVPQFLHIFKDLLQSIVLYKSNRQKDTTLSADELNELAELALKLEVLMHTIGMHRIDVKRVAPFVLIFVINLMVSGKRPTTLYPKIKTHIEAICYSLIGICDHRIGSFILRCSNEAARQTYELLVKDHKKYHKFKGKV